MKGRTARITFLAICLVLAGLLLSGVITARTSSWVFAGSLVLLGGVSRGFRRS